MKNNRLTIILAIVVLILLVPFIAMQFTSEVDWNIADFVIMGTLMLGTGLSIELVMRKTKSMAKRMVICGALLFALFIVWAELAVGIFGTPFAGS